MNHTTIAVGDLKVNRLGFGAMRVCGPQVWGPPKDRPAALKVLRRAYELGCNFFDTADSYGPHVDEELIAEALHPYPKDLVIATKGGLVRPSAPRWDENGRPEHIRQAIEGSLRRLRVERIDLYQLHAPDPKVPLEDSLRPIVEAQKAGKIRHVGISNVDTNELQKAMRVAKIVSVQNQYNVGERASEPVLQACERLGIAFLPWYPLGSGSSLKISNVKKIAEKRKAAPAQVAIAWLLAKSPVMLPIPGTGSLAHLEENVKAAALALSKEEMALLG
jgi:aryl-alcohol dehydrogenase-like predicted oxidoreductase